MRRILSLKTAIFGLLFFGLMSCQDREVGIQILNLKPYDLDSCEVSTEDVFMVSGRVDLALRDDYIVNPLVRNNLADVSELKGLGASDARVATNGVVLKSAEIEYSPLDGIFGNIPKVRTIPLSGTVGENSQLLLFNFPLIESEVMEALRSSDTFFLIDGGAAEPKRTSVTLLTTTRVKGETVDGRVVESEPFLFPVEICNGCMVTYPASLLQERNGRLVCPADQNVDTEESISEESFCPNLVGMDAQGTNCLDCQGYAVNTFSRQLCQPNTRP